MIIQVGNFDLRSMRLDAVNKGSTARVALSDNSDEPGPLKLLGANGELVMLLKSAGGRVLRCTLVIATCPLLPGETSNKCPRRS